MPRQKARPLGWRTRYLRLKKSYDADLDQRDRQIRKEASEVLSELRLRLHQQRGLSEAEGLALLMIDAVPAYLRSLVSTTRTAELDAILSAMRAEILRRAERARSGE